MKTLTCFAINARNLISTITASNLYDELNNSSLLFDLIQKLPPSYQMKWANQKMMLVNQNKKPNLSEFDKWIFNIGITASSITVGHCTNKTNKDKTNKKAYLHSHNKRVCFVCNNNNCKSVTSCKTFLSLDRG